MADTLLDWAEQAARTQNAYQDQRMNDMKIKEYEQDAPIRNQYKQAQTEQLGIDTDIKRQKIISALAADVVGKLDKSNIQDPAQRQEFIGQSIEAYKPYLQNVLKLPVNEHLNEQQVRALAGNANDEESQDWVVINDVNGPYLMNKKTSEIKAATHDGKQLKTPNFDFNTQYGVGLSKKLADLVSKGVISQEASQHILQNLSGGNQPAQTGQPTEQQAPTGQPTVTFDPNMSPEKRALAEQDWENYTKGVENQNAQFGGTPSTGGNNNYGGSIPSEAQRLKQKEDINVNANLEEQAGKDKLALQKAKNERIQSVNELLGLLKRPIDGQDIEDVIKKSTGSFFGKKRDDLLASIGETTEGANAIAQLKPIHEWLTSLVPRMQGPQSNFDVERYKAMAGDIANPEIPSERRIQSLRSLMSYLEDYQKSNGEKEATETPSIKTPSNKTTSKVKFMGFDNENS